MGEITFLKALPGNDVHIVEAARSVALVQP